MPCRYYALTVSVGRLAAGLAPTRAVFELQQWQPVVDAPPAAHPPVPGTAAVLYAQQPLAGAPGAAAGLAPAAPPGDVLLELELSRDLPSAPGAAGPFGYCEVWSSFRTRNYFHQGREWTTASFPAEARYQGNQTRRALVSLPEVMLPRRALVRTRGGPVTTLPYLSAYLRQRSLRPVGEQATITHRVLDPDGSPAGAAAVAPPDWIHRAETLRFLLSLGSARIPGEAQFLCLSSETSVLVDVLDTPASALPELCLLVPSGEVLDLVEYDDAIPLPREVGPDEWASVFATVRVQYTDDGGAGPAAKRAFRG